MAKKPFQNHLLHDYIATVAMPSPLTRRPPEFFRSTRTFPVPCPNPVERGQQSPFGLTKNNVGRSQGASATVS